MYSDQRYLFDLIIDTRKGNNNQISGGLPHSEILGSKPIPGSPKLIAGYHVLHRLLLPRHPPNALIALDPTRKEQGSSGSEVYFSRSRHAGSHARNLVSVLDLDSIALCHLRTPEGTHGNQPPLTRADQRNADVFLSLRCQYAGEPAVWMNQTTKPI